MSFLHHFATRFTRRVSLLFFLAVSIHAAEQNAVSVEGRIIEERTGEPLAHISVVLFGGRKPTSAATDTTGTYRLTGIPPGTYTLDVDPSRVRHVSTRITVGDQPLHVPDLRTHAKIEIRGRIEPRGWQHLMVTAYPNGGGVSVFGDGTFLLRLEEGEFRLGLNIPKTHVVKSITFGSRDLMKKPLVVRAPTQQQIRIVLAAKPASPAPTLPSPAPRVPPPPAGSADRLLVHVSSPTNHWPLGAAAIMLHEVNEVPALREAASE